MVGDTMGELLLLYGCADIAFVGGSLVDNGGHNMLEAAAWSLPIMSGNSMHNFYDISQKFQQAGALKVVNGEDELVEQLQTLLTDSAQRQQMGRSALEVVQQNRGALKRLEHAIHRYIDVSVGRR
jgi:3-deoxy-D-manno-octulosonic-acid transferase